MIYLDYNATAPMRPEVADAMFPFIASRWGNPSSSYSFGNGLKSEISEAREAVGALIDASADEILFTASATESNNTAFFSALAAKPSRRHIVISSVEHSAVLGPARYYEQHGFRVTRVAVDANGQISLDEVRDSITPETAIVSLMWANNETGVVFPIESIAATCRDRGVTLHCDAVQAVGKLPVSLKQLPIDYLSFSAHKLGGPKGVGALYVRRGLKFSPQILGGHQELNRRGGTENVPAIIGFGLAANCVMNELPYYAEVTGSLRDALESNLLRGIPGSFINGGSAMRLPNTSNCSFPGVETDALLLMMSRAGICASAGSACLAESAEPSHVIKAMRHGGPVLRDYLRFSIGLGITAKDIEVASQVVISAVRTIRDLARPI